MPPKLKCGRSHRNHQICGYSERGEHRVEFSIVHHQAFILEVVPAGRWPW